MKSVTEADIKRQTKNWIERLRLAHWQIQVVIGDGSVKSDKEAEVASQLDYNHATIKYGPNWVNWDWSDMEEIIVHELMHLHLHQLWNSALEAKAAFNQEASNLYCRRLEHEAEMAVDALTLVALDAWRTE